MGKPYEHSPHSAGGDCAAIRRQGYIADEIMYLFCSFYKNIFLFCSHFAKNSWEQSKNGPPV